MQMNETVVCEVCGVVVERSKYFRHIKYGHKEKREHKCNLCQKSFTSAYNLQYHMAHHINARNFLCNECPRAYNTAADLAQHQRIHEKQRDPYKCDQCGMIFHIRSKYNTHMRTHQSGTSSGPKECTICNRKFVCLSSHNRIVHLGLRAYPCNECGKSFGKKSGLDRHITTVHEKIKAFRCEIEGCNGAFGEKSQLTKHMKIHSDRDQSYCSFCKQQYDDIKSHFESFHCDLSHTCHICFKRFSKQSSLNVHVKIFHTLERNFFCDFCPNKGFAERSQLKRHLRRHQEENEFNEEESIDGNKLETEKIFVNDLSEVKLESLEETTPIDDVLVEMEIKKEILSDEEIEVKCEPELIMKETSSPTDDFETKSVEEIKDENFALILNEVESSQSERTDETFDCLKCDKRFNKSDHLNVHCTAVHTESKFDCDECGRSFSYKSALDRHIKVLHRNQRNHICMKCGRTFGTKYDLETHFESNHNESRKSKNRRTCKVCGKIFSKERNLQIHVLAIHNENSFECEICLKKFSFKSAKERHLKVVHYNQRSHQCVHCQKYFGTKYDLRNHISYNHSLNPEEIGKYFCSICEKSFTSSSALKRHHKGVHENIKQKGPRDYRCKFCKETFSNKYQKEKHLAQVHQDGLKLKRVCLSCNSEFELFEDFKKHVNELHPKAFICLICGVDNVDGDAFNVHMEHHKHIEMDLRRYICDFCGHRLFNKIQLKVHMRKHMKEANFYVCDICGQSYRYIAPFLYHKKVHEGRKEFICSHCGKEFMRKQDLTVHIRHHTQEKPFKCSVCGKKFAARQILQIHLQTHSATKKIFNCDVCNLSFNDRNGAKIHDEAIHPDRRPFWCSICHKSFKLEHLLKIHLKHKHNPEKSVELTILPEVQPPNDFLLNFWNN